MIEALIAFLVLEGLFLLVAILMALTPVFAAPKNPNPIKNAPYECGEIFPIGRYGRWPFVMQYYGYLIMFLVLDTISIFLFLFSYLGRESLMSYSILLIAFLLPLLLVFPYGLMLARRVKLWSLETHT